jgi:hypothetical protein
MTTIERILNHLKSTGAEVEIEHLRVHAVTGELHPIKFYHHPSHPISSFISPRGGLTRATIKVPKLGGTDDYVGEAFCSLEDNFNRRTGALFALRRAMEKMREARSAS